MGDKPQMGEQIDTHARGGGAYKDPDGDGHISHNEAVGGDGNPVRARSATTGPLLRALRPELSRETEPVAPRAGADAAALMVTVRRWVMTSTRDKSMRRRRRRISALWKRPRWRSSFWIR
jgi:hypothetical protein